MLKNSVGLIETQLECWFHIYAFEVGILGRQVYVYWLTLNYLPRGRFPFSINFDSMRSRGISKHNAIIMCTNAAVGPP